jgi:ubiquinone/menaquinone biosynthesis C-methylase UbiE
MTRDRDEDGDLASHYDALSKEWSNHYDDCGGHFARRLRNVHELVPTLGPDSQLLDVGCATGEVGRTLHERFGCRVVGLDLSRRMIACCLQAAAEGVFAVGSATHLPLPPQTFHLVLSLSVIEWIRDYTLAVSEAARVLRPGGWWVVSIPNWKSPVRRLERLASYVRKSSYLQWHGNRVSVEEFTRLCEEHGLAPRRKLWHVLPGISGNLPAAIGANLGMMCMLSFEKQR